MTLPRNGFVQPVEGVAGGVPVPVSGAGGVLNRASAETNQKPVAVPGTAEQLQAQAVPDGFSIFVEALSDNLGNIYLAYSQADAQNHTKAQVMKAGAFRTLFLKDVSTIWIDADNPGEGVQWTVEV